MIYGYVTTYTEDKLTPLYVSENGLGLEIVQGINHLTYIQIDLLNIILGKDILNLTIHTTDGYRLFGSSKQGTLGTTIYTSKSQEDILPIPYFGTYRYVSLSAFGNIDANVYLYSIQF